MTLADFIGNIVNRLTTLGVNRSEIFASEIIDELNNVAPSVRLQDIQRGNKDFYTIREDMVFTVADHFQNGLFTAKLDPKPTPQLTTDEVVVRAYGYRTDNELKTDSTYQEGDYARYNNKILMCLEDFDGIDTTDKIWENEPVKHITKNTQYPSGTVIFDQKTATYYRTTDTMYGDTVPNDWTALYWKVVGSSGFEPFMLDFEELRTSQILPFSYAIYHNKLYATEDIRDISIWYIPEWEAPDTTEEIKLSDNALTQVREMVTNQLKQKLVTGQPEENE